MKGKKIYKVAGKDVTFTLDVGAIEDFQEWLEETGQDIDLDKAIKKLKNVRYCLSFMSNDGNGRLHADEFRSLTIDEMQEIMELFAQLGGKGKGKP